MTIEQMALENKKYISDFLIAQGVKPGLKKYKSVRPRGLYMLFPSMWRAAKQLEDVPDMTYYIMMDQLTRPVYKRIRSEG